MYGQGGIRTPSVSNVTDLQSAAFKPFGTPTQKKVCLVFHFRYLQNFSSRLNAQPLKNLSPLYCACFLQALQDSIAAKTSGTGGT